MFEEKGYQNFMDKGDYYFYKADKAINFLSVIAISHVITKTIIDLPLNIKSLDL